jgi:hypothetical protein
MKLKITLLIGIILIFLVYSCISILGNCSEDSVHVVNAKNLDDAQLNKLLQDAKILLYRNELRDSFNIEEMPDSIKSLSPVHITSHGFGVIWLYLETCGIDTKIILFIDTELDEISIVWGDVMDIKSLILWPRT